MVKAVCNRAPCTVDGRNSAPPKKPWNDDFQTMVLHGFKVMQYVDVTQLFWESQASLLKMPISIEVGGAYRLQFQKEAKGNSDFSSHFSRLKQRIQALGKPNHFQCQLVSTSSGK